MNLERRLKSVERVLGEQGACPRCKDAGNVLSVVIERQETFVPKTCPECGKPYERQMVIVIE